jgi:N utilization substance protein A
MELKEFKLAISQIAEERGIPQEKVLETIEAAIAAAYKKEYGKKGQLIRAKLDFESGKVKFWQVKVVVDKSMIYSEEELEKLKSKKGEKEEIKGSAGKEKIKFNPERHILIDEAKKIDPKIKVGEELIIPLKEKEEYGRIAAQTAKQVILQKIKEIEKETILKEYKGKEGEIVSGIVQRVEPKAVYLNIGKTIGILPKEEQVQGEFYRPGQRLRVYILKVEETTKGPMIILSRAYPKLVSKLFELEVPEIQAGQVEIKSIAREAGSRTKIAVLSKAEGIDAIGAMVGQRGTRVQAVINELGGEKIDIIQYSEKPEEYVANSLSPAKVLEVKILPKNKALAIVAEDQLSLAIGKDGQNVRLAAKLTGWKIDVRSKEELEKEK